MRQWIPSSPLSSRASYFITAASAQISAGVGVGIQSLMNGVRQLISTIGWSSLRVRPMMEDDLPYSDDYTNMVSEVASDTNTVYSQLPQLAQQGLYTANYGQAQIASLTSSLNTLKSLVTNATANANQVLCKRSIGIRKEASIARRRGEIFVESFVDNSHIDFSKSYNISLDVDTASVTLQHNSDINLGSKIAPFIAFYNGTQVLGFPGNTLEVETPQTNMVPSQSTPSVTFVGQSNTNSDPFALLDGNPDTVYEYEKVILTDQNQPMIKMGSAWFYSESTGHAVKNVMQTILPDTWSVNFTATDSTGNIDQQTLCEVTESAPANGLVMDLWLYLQTPQYVNYLDLSPYLSPLAPAALPITIQSITVIDSTNAVTSIPILPNSTSIITDTAFYFPTSILATSIHVVLCQPFPYETYIGHPFIEATVDTHTTHKFLGVTYSSSDRMSHPRLETQSAALNYNSNKSGSLIKDVALVLSVLTLGVAGWIIKSLFGSTKTVTVESTSTGIDVFKGLRWSIGLRGVSVFQYNYSPTGVLVTTPISYVNPIGGATLQVEDQDNVGTAISYAISPDNGSTWMSIDPTGELAIGFETPTSQLLLQATFTGANPTSSGVTSTPVLYGYTLKGYYA